jgi:glycogen synthase
VKVLILTNLYPPDVVGGYELGCRQVVDALRARGHDVRVLTSAPRTPVESPPHVLRALKLTDLWDFYSESRRAPLALRLKEIEAFQINAFNAHALMQTLDDFAPDVVYAWMLVGLGGLGLLACLHHLRVPWVWHLMDEVPAKLCTLFYQVQPQLTHEVSRQLQGFYLACSRRLVADIEQAGFSLKERVDVVPNWVTGPLPPPRTRFYDGGRLRVVAAAALIDRKYDKGIDLLIQAASLLRGAGQCDFEIDIYGRVTDGHYGELIRSLQLSDHVSLKGPLEQVELLSRYDHYDMFAFPGRTSEPFGFAPLEAMARGCVPVINHRCGVGEWLVHGVHALKAARDAGSFAAAIAGVLNGQVALAPLARRGQAAVGRDFHLDAVLPRIERALQRAAGSPREGAGAPADAYRLAVLAEKLAEILMCDAHAA